MSKEIDEEETNKIMETLVNYYIIPSRLHEFGEEQQFDEAIKMKGKHLKELFKKAGYKMDSLIEYVGFCFNTFIKSKYTRKR